MTPPPLKSVNFHLNIKSSSLESADGVDFIARVLLDLVQMSHSLHRLKGRRFPPFLCFVSDTIIFHSSLPLNAYRG